MSDLEPPSLPPKPNSDTSGAMPEDEQIQITDDVSMSLDAFLAIYVDKKDHAIARRFIAAHQAAAVREARIDELEGVRLQDWTTTGDYMRERLAKLQADHPAEKDKQMKQCEPCGGTGKLIYPNTGIENDCYHCNGFGRVPT